MMRLVARSLWLLRETCAAIRGKVKRGDDAYDRARKESGTWRRRRFCTRRANDAGTHAAAPYRSGTNCARSARSPIRIASWASIFHRAASPRGEADVAEGVIVELAKLSAGIRSLVTHLTLLH